MHAFKDQAAPLLTTPAEKSFHRCRKSEGRRVFGVMQRLYLLKANILRWLIFFSIALPSYGQIFSFGVKAGVPLTDAYSTIDFGGGNTSTAYQNRYLVGPTAEIHFPLNLSFEVDALYRHSGTTAVSGFVLGGLNERAHTDDWQIPLLAKYDFNKGPIRPFVDAGVVYRHLSLSGNALETYFPVGTQSVNVKSNSNLAGIAVGGGITLKVLKLRLSPEIRYSRWFNTSNAAPVGTSLNGNQADLLVGFTF